MHDLRPLLTEDEATELITKFLHLFGIVSVAEALGQLKKRLFLLLASMRIISALP